MIKLISSAPEGQLIHVPMACLQFGGGVDYFISSVFNYPTLSDAFKYAAYDALGKLNAYRAKGATG